MHIRMSEALHAPDLKVEASDLCAILLRQTEFELQTKRHIAHDLQPREQRRLPKHHTALAPCASDRRAITGKCAAVWIVQSCDQIKECAPPQPLGPIQQTNVSLRNGETHVIERLQPSRPCRERFGYTLRHKLGGKQKRLSLPGWTIHCSHQSGGYGWMRTSS